MLDNEDSVAVVAAKNKQHTIDKKYIASIISKVEGVVSGVESKVDFWLDSGNYALNRVISGDYTKGLPFGRVIEVFGDPSCLVAGTRVALSDGSLVPIEEFGDKHLQNIRVPVQTRGGTDEALVFHKFDNQEVIEVVLSSGAHITGTPNHPLLKVSAAGCEWVRIDQLKVGDELKTIEKIPSTINTCVRTNFTAHSNKMGPQYKGNIPAFFCDDMGLICGYILGDGWVRSKSKGVGFCVNDSEMDILPRIMSAMQNMFNTRPYIDRREPSGERDHTINRITFKSTQPLTYIHYDNKSVAKMLGFLATKRVPDFVFRSPDSVVKLFLSWLFEADGCVFTTRKKWNDGSRAIQLKSAYPGLLTDVQLLLLRFGVRAKIYGTNLTIRSKDDILLFAKEVGFVSQKKRSKMDILEANVSSLREPRHYKNVVKKIIKRKDKATVYDLEIPNGHEFIANGIVSHNTGKSLLIYHWIAAVQRMGGIAILDDTEDAYTEEFGKMLGIDSSSLILLSSLTVEEHFEKVFLGWKDVNGKAKPGLVDLIWEKDTDCPILIALDSLALLSTRHEQEVMLEKPDMSKAKQIRAALRNSARYMKKGNIIHVVSNHVTSKIGVMFGNPRTTPGGTGIPFSASVRLELMYHGKIKDVENTDRIIGVMSTAKGSKNRIAAPFQEVSLDIYFDKGVDPFSGLLDNMILNGTAKEGEKRGYVEVAGEQVRKSEFPEYIKKNLGKLSKIVIPQVVAKDQKVNKNT